MKLSREITTNRSPTGITADIAPPVLNFQTGPVPESDVTNPASLPRMTMSPEDADAVVLSEVADLAGGAGSPEAAVGTPVAVESW